MHPDAVDLREFYNTPLGRTARLAIHRQLRQWWPDLSRLSVLGVGYATPYLRPLVDAGTSVFALMPPQLGVAAWPGDGPGLTVLGEADELPFAPCSFDRILVIHALEALEHRQALRELWRVLTPQGRLIVAVPNRRGVWARVERTPFGHGNPYSVSQLNQILRDHLFVPERNARRLYFPPVESRFFLASAAAWEKLGQRWFPALGGLTMVEASKQIYAMPADRAQVLRRRILKIPIPSPASL